MEGEGKEGLFRQSKAKTSDPLSCISCLSWLKKEITIKKLTANDPDVDQLDPDVEPFDRDVKKAHRARQRAQPQPGAPSKSETIMKKSAILAAVSACALAFSLAPAVARAEDVGLNLGLRTGYAIALGDVIQREPMSEGIAGAIPLHLDATYAITPTFNAGLYVAYGNGDKGSNADAPESIRTRAYGLQANRLFGSGWAGVFGGLESMNWDTKASASAQTVTATFSGWQAGLQGGADWNVRGHFAVGPFASLALGQYTGVKLEKGGNSSSQDIPDPTMHQWLTLGLRGSFSL